MSAAVAARLERLLGTGALEHAVLPGGPAVPLASPASIEAMAEVVRLAAAEHLAVMPVGLLSKAAWRARPERVDLLLSTRRLTGIVSHVPDDGTISARAGASMSELRAKARAGGHFLTPDVARPERATLGGTLAWGQSGADRLRFGPARNHLLGAKVLLADGSVARSGGQLVKNVTGYDLHKLYCGSRGTLCVILEAALRLFPEPEREIVLAASAADSASALGMARAALALPARTVSLAMLQGPGESWSLHARLFGKRAGADRERALLAAAWPDARVLEDALARQEAERVRDAAFGADATPWLRASMLRTKVEAALTALERWTSALPLRPSWRAEPGIASIDVLLRPSEGAALGGGELASAVLDLRRQLEPLGAEVELLGADAEALRACDPLARGGPAVDLMRRIKAALDPYGVFAGALGSASAP